MSEFKDHFSHSSSNYQKYRPTYPDELFTYIASLCQKRSCAWDVGTGNGQAAIKLTKHFDNVLATDPSANQIESAIKHHKVDYHVSKAEGCPSEDDKFDLITVAQAFHWFDFEKFYKEVRRVAKASAHLAIWTYTLAKIEPEIDAIVEHFYRKVVGDYWPIERDHIESLYENIEFPFEQVEVPEFNIHLDYNMDAMLEYLGTWSAVKNYKLDKGSDPIELIRADVESAWGNKKVEKKVQWPIYLKMGKL